LNSGWWLAEAILLMEETVEPLLQLTDEGIQAITFVVRWGPSYDPSPWSLD
jgi:hypothetical protein